MKKTASEFRYDAKHENWSQQFHLEVMGNFYQRTIYRTNGYGCFTSPNEKIPD